MRCYMTSKAVEILLEPGAEAQIKLMARRLGTITEVNAEYVAALSDLLGKGRPIVLMGLIYFAASQFSKDDLESAA